jgi:hypothetical protein
MPVYRSYIFNDEEIILSNHDRSYKVIRNALDKMKGRCRNVNNKDYPSYGGRGIRCLINCVGDIIESIGLKPGPEFSIDRIDNDKDYTIDNIQWATASEQQRNKRNTRLVTIDGITKPFIQWYEDLNPTVSYCTALDRYRHGVKGIYIFFTANHPETKARYLPNVCMTSSEANNVIQQPKPNRVSNTKNK